MIVAVQGREGKNGCFQVSRVFYPQLAPQKPLQHEHYAQIISSSSKAASPASGTFVAFLSGLHVGSPAASSVVLSLLSDYLCGFLVPASAPDTALSRRIVHCVVAGNSLHRFDKKKMKQFLKEETDVESLARPMQLLDAFFADLAAKLPLTVLPGKDDPANFTLPQQPFHPCLFPESERLATFQCVTNPCRLRLDGALDIVGSAGENIADLSRYSRVDGGEIAQMERCLRLRHMAPTAPDTLSCYSFADSDPFVLTATPHIFFAGNANSFQTALVRGDNGQLCRTLLIPSFATTGTLVMVDVSRPEMPTHAITFAIPGLHKQHQSADPNAMELSQSDSVSESPAA
jgi:DNA polymerase delta subunit 2